MRGLLLMSTPHEHSKQQRAAPSNAVHQEQRKMSEQTPAALESVERQRAVEALYIRNFATIRDACGVDPKLSFDAEERVSEAVAKHLSSYDGPLTDTAFCEWVRSLVSPAMFFAALHRDVGDYVRGAIRKVFAPCADLGISEQHVDDAEQATWLWAWENLESLRAQNQKARPKTRLYAVAKFKALSIRKTALRAKERFNSVSLSRLGTDPNDYEWCGVVIEPLASREEREGAFERLETVGPRAA